MTVKRILLFHGIDICQNTLNCFSDIVAECLRRRGIDAGFIDLNVSDELLPDEYVREINKGFDAALAFNSQGQELTYMDGKNVFEYLNVPFINWIVDHPAEHFGVEDEIIKDYHVVCLDRDHVKYINRYLPKIKYAHFCPLGGTGSGNSDFLFSAYRNRRYDVIFTGTYLNLDILGDDIRELPSEDSALCADIIDLMLENSSINTDAALVRVLKDKNIELSDEYHNEKMKVARKATFYLRQYLREEIIRYIAASGLKLDLFGEGWDLLGDLGNIKVHGPVTYDESVALNQDTRIALNVMPLFKDGIHDRVPTAMLHGAVAMTDTSYYINEFFDTDPYTGELMIYDIKKPEKIAESIFAALNDEASLYHMAERGRKKAQTGFTWDVRVKEIINILESL